MKPNSCIDAHQNSSRLSVTSAASRNTRAASTVLVLAAAACSLLGTSAEAIGPNLVQNPSFEINTGTQFVGAGFWPLMSGQGQSAANFPNWTVTAPSYQGIAVIGDNTILGGNTWASLAAWPAPQTTSGRYYFQADGDYTSGVNATIAQVITGLTIGASYQLSFDWGAGVCSVVPPCDTPPPSNSGWDITFGTNTDSVNSGPVPFQSFSGWQTYAKVFTATATSQTLSFLSKGGPTGVPPMSLLDNVSVTAVPGPFGILGVASAFGCSRRLRRRIGLG